MFLDVEFTDRYGPSGPPSWLRGCFDQCEAMGYVPVYVEAGDRRPHSLRPAEPEADPVLLALWHDAERVKASEDGWHFVKCPSCHGSGRVSWWVTLARIPKWIWRGVGICWEFRPSAPMHCPEWSWSKRAWIAFKVAFLADLGVRM